MTKRPQDTPAEEPDGGNPHIRFRGGPGLSNRPGLLNRLENDPRICVTDDDCAAIAKGMEYTPTDLMLLKFGTHPYSVVASRETNAVDIQSDQISAEQPTDTQ